MKYWILLLFLPILLVIGCKPNNRDASQPITQFPPPTGSHQVGRIQLDMIDPSREEVYTTNNNDVRTFTATIFYPTSSTENAKRAPYVEASLIEYIAEDTEVPAPIWQSFQPNAYLNTPVADGEFPIILFSPGLGIPIAAYTGHMEELASHGYVVVGISHTYAVPAIALSDGRVLAATDSIFPAMEEALDTPEEANVFINDVLAVWVADMLFTLDELEDLNDTHPLLASHLDLSRVGAMGHSLGGATAFSAAYENEQILAAIDMDGSLYGDVLTHGLPRPAMTMAQDVTILAEQGVPAEIIESELATYAADRASALQRSVPGYDIIVTGASHGTFVTDALVIASTFSELATPDLVGTIEDLDQVRQQIHETTLAFLNAHVAQIDAPSIDNLTLGGFYITTFTGE